MATFKENFSNFAKTVGNSLSILKRNIQQAADGVNTGIRSDVRDTLNKYYWAREYDEWSQGEVLGGYVEGFSNVVYCKASDMQVYYDTPIDFSSESYVSSSGSLTWTFVNHLIKGRYLIDVSLMTWWFKMANSSRTYAIWASLKDPDDNLITQAYISNQGDSGKYNDCRTPGITNSSGVFEVEEEDDYEFTVTTKVTNSYNIYGVLLGFSRQF